MPVVTASNEKLSRRERERLARRREIMQAAQQVFAEKGYTHATLEEIAQRAEFGKGTLYNYFDGGKEGILFAIFDDMYDDLCRLIETSFTPDQIADGSLRAAFQDFVTAYLDYFLEQQELFMILVKEVYRMTFSDDREKAAYFQRQRERQVNALVPTLKTAIEQGQMKPLPAHAVAHMMLGNINGLQMHHCLEGGDTLDDPVLRSSAAAADFLTTMLFDGLAPSAPSFSLPDPNLS